MSVVDLEALRASMRAAQVFGKGQYILVGRHVLRVAKLFYKRTMIDGVGKESIIAEFTVLATTNAEMQVGETRSVVFNFEKKGWMSRFKALLLALAGVDPDGKIPPQAETFVGDVYVALRDDSERQRMNLPENFMANRCINVEGIPGTIKNGVNAGKPLVDLKWTPYFEAAPMQAAA
jgi:hypothetical protein